MNFSKLSVGLLRPLQLSSSSTQLDPKRNSIGFIRLMLAIVVIYSHAFDLGGLGHDVIKALTADSYGAGAIAVDGFFGLSGCLITASYLRVNTLSVFLWHRCLRIFPAYWVCIGVSAIALPLLFGGAPDGSYIWHNLLDPIRYSLESTIGLILPTLLGWAPDLTDLSDKLPWIRGQDKIAALFSTNPYPNSINNSLWTLGHEFRLYLLVGCLGFVGWLRREVVVALFLLLWACYGAAELDLVSFSSMDGLRTSVHFLMGAVFYFWRPSIKRSLVVAAFAAGLLALVAQVYWVVSPLTTAYIMFWLADALPFHGFGRKRDYSYGLYIYSFPIQQILAAWGLARWGLFPYFILTLSLTGILAVASWHWIEDRALGWKNALSPQKHPEVT